MKPEFVQYKVERYPVYILTVVLCMIVFLLILFPNILIPLLLLIFILFLNLVIYINLIRLYNNCYLFKYIPFGQNSDSINNYISNLRRDIKEIFGMSLRTDPLVSFLFIRKVYSSINTNNKKERFILFYNPYSKELTIQMTLEMINYQNEFLRLVRNKHIA